MRSAGPRYLPTSALPSGDTSALRADRMASPPTGPLRMCVWDAPCSWPRPGSPACATSLAPCRGGR
eukprot:14073797-Alexandrium_andersonii.AAC.1